jgi:hypothetical protein
MGDIVASSQLSAVSSQPSDFFNIDVNGWRKTHQGSLAGSEFQEI